MNTTKSAIAAILAIVVSVSPILPGVPGGGDPGRAAAAAPIIHLQSALTGLNSPVFVTSARDGSNRLFVLERAGIIKVVQPGSPDPAVFLDLRGTVLSV